LGAETLTDAFISRRNMKMFVTVNCHSRHSLPWRRKMMRSSPFFVEAHFCRSEFGQSVSVRKTGPAFALADVGEVCRLPSSDAAKMPYRGGLRPRITAAKRLAALPLDRWLTSCARQPLSKIIPRFRSHRAAHKPALRKSTMQHYTTFAARRGNGRRGGKETNFNPSLRDFS